MKLDVQNQNAYDYAPTIAKILLHFFCILTQLFIFFFYSIDICSALDWHKTIKLVFLPFALYFVCDKVDTRACWQNLSFFCLCSKCIIKFHWYIAC